MSKGENRRMVKKSKNSDTLNIKVSTADKDMLSKDNRINIKISGQDKNAKTNSVSKLKQIKEEDDKNIQSRISKLIENNKKSQQEVDSIMNQIKEKSEKDLSEILALNTQLSQLEKDHNELSNKNKTLLSKLKELEDDVTKRFENKFKLSKVIKNQKKIENQENLETSIKIKDKQKENVEKDIKYNKNEIKRLNKLLKKNKEGSEQQLSDELKAIKDNINKIEKEIKELNKIKSEHQLCKKSENFLKCQFNVLKNDCEFEEKKKDMIKTKKRVQTKIKNVNMTMEYGEKVRKEMLAKTTNKYSSKIRIVNYKSYNFLLKENEDKKANERKLSSYKNLQTVGNTDLPDFSTYLKKDISYRIDDKPPKKYLFSQEEKEILKKMIPNEYYNNYNEKYNKIENELTEIEDKFKENDTIKKEIYYDNIKNDANNLKLKELEYKTNSLKGIVGQNNKKIVDIKKKIQILNEDIKKQNYIFYHKNKNNKIIKERIETVKKIKMLQTEQ